MSQEIEKLAQLFFSYGVFRDIYSTPKNIDINLIQPSINTNSMDKEYNRIKREILTSIWKKRYIDLCDCLKSNYNSVSEADWAFLQIVSRFINCEAQYKKTILKFFFQKDRLKKDRLDYFDRTITKILSNSVKTKDQFVSTTFSNKNLNYTHISKKIVLKVCNIMKIFHFGKSMQNFQYITCEAYCGDDVRFITLTGQPIIDE